MALKIPSELIDAERAIDEIEPDPYEGVGGRYAVDPKTGRRVQIVAPPGWVPPGGITTPRTAIAATRPYWDVEPKDTDD